MVDIIIRVLTLLVVIYILPGRLRNPCGQLEWIVIHEQENQVIFEHIMATASDLMRIRLRVSMRLTKSDKSYLIPVRGETVGLTDKKYR